jgi:hypothetical protein
MHSRFGWAAAALLVVSCNNTAPIEAKVDPGALIKTSMNSKVGVLLDEIPASIRDRVAQQLIAEPSSFWITRARNQIALTTYRLVFRQYFYSASGTGAKQQLPLPPPEVQKVTIAGAPRREMVDGHDYVLVDYAMNSVLITSVTSPKDAETKLSATGGIWNEPFILPIDPELLFQRTRFACVDEEDFPPNSVDAEEMDSFYDQACLVESKLSSTACHLTELPTQSCVEALDAKVGKVTTEARFERIAWDGAIANAYRVGRITNTTGPDLQLIEEEFRTNRIVYRYIPSTSCTVLEGCVGAPGWRRLLQFSTSDKNMGAKTLDIGAVDYYLSGKNGYVSDWGLFELNTCHQHYHFKHYGDFKYGPEIERKNGFCLQSTARVLNHEQGPLTNKYGGCGYQGVEASWADQYKAGLECQWVDVTTVDTSKRAITYPLSFTTNPDGFLCEGTPVLDAQGLPVWEMTNFVTEKGGPVYRPKCDFYPAWQDNNSHSYNVTLPIAGESFVTMPCTRGQIGPLRNCGLEPTAVTLSCTPGAMTTVSCTAPANAAPQVARLCEFSAKLGVGSACTYSDAAGNGVVEGTSAITFKCPAARDAFEPGGKVSLYTGAAFPGDGDAAVTCTVQ